MSITTASFGNTEQGESVDQITLTNAKGSVLKLITYGAAITELHLPDRDGHMADVVLGFDNLKQYETDSPSFGCCCGRVANRIAKGQFTLDGQPYQLPLNHHGHCLHGGERGFGKRVWQVTTAESDQGLQAIFTYHAADGEEGFPGNLDVTLTYTFTDDDAVLLHYTATTDAPTLVNLTNHSYFNLAGHDSGSAMDHLLKINSENYTATDMELIPTGEIASVFENETNSDTSGGPRNFTTPKPVGQDLAAMLDQPGGGYDLNYCLDNEGQLALAATLFDPKTGRILHCYTDQPGVQLYTGNMMHETFGGKGVDIYHKHISVCLETQKFADAINHPEFPSIVLRPDETYTHRCDYRFGIADGIKE